MTQELKEIAQGLKAFLLNAEEDEIILKAALNQEKAAFNSMKTRANETADKNAGEVLRREPLPPRKPRRYRQKNRKNPPRL